MVNVGQTCREYREVQPQTPTDKTLEEVGKEAFTSLGKKFVATVLREVAAKVESIVRSNPRYRKDDVL